jgi:hypothetical protein
MENTTLETIEEEKPVISPEEAERLKKAQRYHEISKDLMLKLYMQKPEDK